MYNLPKHTSTRSLNSLSTAATLRVDIQSGYYQLEDISCKTGFHMNIKDAIKEYDKIRMKPSHQTIETNALDYLS